jgi:hypothetical protein
MAHGITLRNLWVATGGKWNVGALTHLAAAALLYGVKRLLRIQHSVGMPTTASFGSAKKQIELGFY